MRMVQVQCSFTSTEAIKTLRDWGALDGHLDFHAALKSRVQVQCCFTSTKTIRTIMGGEPISPLLAYSPPALTSFIFVSCLRPHRPVGLLGTISPPLSQLLSSDFLHFLQCCFTATQTIGTVMDSPSIMVPIVCIIIVSIARITSSFTAPEV